MNNELFEKLVLSAKELGAYKASVIGTEKIETDKVFRDMLDGVVLRLIRYFFPFTVTSIEPAAVPVCQFILFLLSLTRSSLSALSNPKSIYLMNAAIVLFPASLSPSITFTVFEKLSVIYYYGE